MRILYLDLDCLRPDHLACYGYPRPTSPNIDRIAAAGVRFSHVYASDVPCLPSRTAFFSGRFGITTGVVNHGGTGAEPFPEGSGRGFATRWNRETLMRTLRDRGLYTATISSFGERHSAFHFYSNFNEIRNPGQRGLETADTIGTLALEWLACNRTRDDWFLHVHFWDPHMPYRTPVEFGEPFAELPVPSWLTEEVRARHFAAAGPHSAQEVIGYDHVPPSGLAWNYPRQPTRVDGLSAVRAMFDGYDTGILFADKYIGLIIESLRESGALADTAIVISGDHGENLGELNVYGDHQTADEFTCHVPFILRWPGLTDPLAGCSLGGLHYQIDLAATLVELAGGTVPACWDGQSIAAELRTLSANAGANSPPGGESDELPLTGRPRLVLSQGAWTCQRALRWDVRDGPDAGQWLCIRTWHDAFHLYPEVMLFELGQDPHEEHNLALARPQLVCEALGWLEIWRKQALARTGRGDPLETVLAEGGPQHTRGELVAYLARLRATGRAHLANALEERHAPTRVQ